MAAGDLVFVVGAPGAAPAPSSGYRDAPARPVVRRPDDTPVQIGHFSPEESRRVHPGTAAILARVVLVAACVALLFLPQYLARLATGRVVWATVTRSRDSTRTKTSRGRTTVYRSWYAELRAVDGGATFEARVPDDHRSRVFEGRDVPVVLVGWWPGASQLGRHVTLHALALIPIGLVMLATLTATSEFTWFGGPCPARRRGVEPRRRGT